MKDLKANSCIEIVENICKFVAVEAKQMFAFGYLAEGGEGVFERNYRIIRLPLTRKVPNWRTLNKLEGNAELSSVAADDALGNASSQIKLVSEDVDRSSRMSLEALKWLETGFLASEWALSEWRSPRRAPSGGQKSRLALLLLPLPVPRREKILEE